MTNRLAHETSPYLLQHKENPVEWFPWGDDAFAKARAEDKPLLISVGYSACHWCHVMAHESFDDPTTAQLMNERFVNVKVDREERPDVDSVLMSAVQAMSGHGGWPLNAFLTPGGVPFYGGTYWPPVERQGMPSFRSVLEAVSDAYRDKKAEIEENAKQVREFLIQTTKPLATGAELTPERLSRAVEALGAQFDEAQGGFGNAPKFPQPAVLEFLLRRRRLDEDESAGEMARATLLAMAAGGIYDQIGGGFHRYSVDRFWLVPHFEKMVYDNAQLARACLDAWRLFGEDQFREVVEETLDYLLREMRGQPGGFFSTQDADSEGEEGAFYVWRLDEIDAVVGSENGPVVRAYWGLTEHGNFEGANILSVPRPLEAVAHSFDIDPERVEAIVERAKEQLYAARSKRIWPDRDDKVIASWNGMILRALAEASRALGRSDYLDAAKQNAAFLLDDLSPEGQLKHSFKDGVAKIDAFLDDYANIIDGLISLYEATFEFRWFDEATRLANEMIARFADDDGVGFYDTAGTPDHLVARPRDLQDGATPSGNAVAADVLLRLHRFTGNEDWRRRGRATLDMLAEPMSSQPLGFGRYLSVAAVELATPREVSIAGNLNDNGVEELARAVFRRFEPATVVGLAAPDDDEIATKMPFLAHRPMQNGKATAYLCERFACLPPVTDPDDLAIQLEQGSMVEWKEY